MSQKQTTAPESQASGEARLKTSCPICGSAVSIAVHNDTFPFCSPRCRLTDLGRWMNERYAVPCSEAAAEEGGGETY